MGDSAAAALVLAAREAEEQLEQQRSALTLPSRPPQDALQKLAMKRDPRQETLWCGQGCVRRARAPALTSCLHTCPRRETSWHASTLDQLISRCAALCCVTHAHLC